MINKTDANFTLKTEMSTCLGSKYPVKNPDISVCQPLLINTDILTLTNRNFARVSNLLAYHPSWLVGYLEIVMILPSNSLHTVNWEQEGNDRCRPLYMNKRKKNNKTSCCHTTSNQWVTNTLWIAPSPCPCMSEAQQQTTTKNAALVTDTDGRYFSFCDYLA